MFYGSAKSEGDALAGSLEQFLALCRDEMTRAPSARRKNPLSSME
jgi:hypothetical protein